MVRLGGRGYLENLSTEFEKDIRNSLLYHGSLPRHVPRQQRRPEDPGATLDDLREVVRLLEDLAPTARRVLGSAHPVAAGIERDLRESRAAFRSREAVPK